MSIAHEEPLTAGLLRALEPGELTGDASYHDGEKPPSTRREVTPLRQLMDDRLLDALVERSRDEAGGLRLTGEGSMLGELVKAVLERALQAELTAHLGYERHDQAGHNSGTPATERSARRCRPGSARLAWKCPGIEPARSSRRSFRSGQGGSPAAWTT